MRRRDDGLDPRAWLLWYMAVSLPALLGRNPWPLLASLLAVIGVRLAWEHRMTAGRSWSYFVRLAIAFAMIGIVFNVLTVRTGEQVLVALPDTLPLIGGELTLNAVVFGVLSGMALVLLVMAGSTVVSLLDWTEIVRLMPSGLTSFAVAGSVAFAFIPQTAIAYREIREAQMARGHRLRGARDLLPIVVPIMSGGLERAVTLSESLESRGFGSPATMGATNPAWTRYCLAGALASGALGTFALATGQMTIALPAYVAMALLFIPAVRIGATTRARRTRYRITRWTGRDSAVAIVAVIAIVVTLIVLQIHPSRNSLRALSQIDDASCRLGAPGQLAWAPGSSVSCPSAGSGRGNQVIALHRDTGITLDDVSFAYDAASKPVLRHVDWQIDEGSFVVVSGASGSGKSTLLRCLNGLVPHFSGGRFGGSVSVNGYDTRRHQTRALSRSVGFVFQEPDAQRVAAIVEDELAFGMEQLGVPRQMMRKRVEEVLDVLGIARLRDREIDTLSGGERQRVAVAAALALQPATLVLDEPTSQLDPWGADEVVTALERLNHEIGLTVVLAEHRLERVLGVADRMRALLPTGQFDGTPGEVVPRLDEEMLPPIIRLGRQLDWEPLPLTLKEARVLVRARDMKPSQPSPCQRQFDSQAVLSLRGVDVTLGMQRALRDISLEVREGETVAVMGRNGSGKTTLLRAIMGFQRIERGKITVGGVDVASSDTAAIALHVGYLPQRPSSILFNETVTAELAFTLRHRTSAVEPDELLRRLDLARLAGRNPRDLSVGEQERVALAAVLVGNPSVLLLDEPTRGMDARRKRALARMLTERSGEGNTTLLVTHDVELVAETATRVVLLGDGEIVADGPPHEVLAGSLSYTTQINKLFGGTFLTVEDVLAGMDSETAFS